VTKPDLYEIYAIRYARHERRAAENFIGGDEHDGPMPMDYFVWLVRNADCAFVIDTGFNAATARKRCREFLRCPTEGLARLGIEAREVRDVVITHMHYDHAGNADLFPCAAFHIQDDELNFATGRHMTDARHSTVYDVDNVAGMVRAVYDGRVCFHKGDTDLAPGVSVHHIGGHTMGLQVVRVATKRGNVVLASDATHYYANMLGRRPFPIVFDLDAMVAGWQRLRSLASSDRHVIPGHDPEVMYRYPAAAPGLKDIAVRLDEDPET